LLSTSISGARKLSAVPPIFVIGINRSGTTLLSLMLDSHSRIAIPYESHFFVNYYRTRSQSEILETNVQRLALVKSILAEPYVQRWDYQVTSEQINLDNCTNLAQTIDEIYMAYARHFEKDIWGDKTPSYACHLEILNNMFPTSRFIHIIRDGRDVALSI